MNHQVLARKWRPREFASLIGQDHVVRALTHALTTGRLHHAYLFTGTRGVGKTTIARILAKSLNCETGVSATPCGKCSACTEIDEGRFTDYLELDAASNRGVDEMVQLLENAVYAPSAGRYKVYVIDEVHQLTSHAFNAMLKTLEEPPAHVIFILATTDPQKVPVTVLSRCLQFNLKNMPPSSVAQHLAQVLGAEGVPFEQSALTLIGRAAAGSMRDALSLLDQAIAFSAGNVTEAAAGEMLGVVDRKWLGRVLDALVAGDGPELVSVADEMLSNNAPFARTLADLAALLQRVALAQVGAFGDDDDPALLRRYALALPAEDLQVYYQIAIHGGRDLSLAPDEHCGFTMTLLRLLAFRPAPDEDEPARVARPVGAVADMSQRGPAPALRAPAPTAVATPAPTAVATPAPTAVATPAPSSSFDGNWPALAAHVRLTGFAQQFMQQSELVSHEGLSLKVRVPIRPLAEAATVTKVREALSAHFGAPVRLSVEVGVVTGTTVAAVNTQRNAERMDQARASLESDPFVQSLLTDFGGRILPDSVKPNDL